MTTKQVVRLPFVLRGLKGMAELALRPFVVARAQLVADHRIEGAAEVGEHKTSMLQDLERGRPMEIDALHTVPLELARMHGVSTPTLDILAAMVRARAREAGLYGA